LPSSIPSVVAVKGVEISFLLGIILPVRYKNNYMISIDNI